MYFQYICILQKIRKLINNFEVAQKIFQQCKPSVNVQVSDVPAEFYAICLYWMQFQLQMLDDESICYAQFWHFCTFHLGQ